jgi:hypothetical protein
MTVSIDSQKALKAEKQALNNDGKETLGIALSGGGIRSASFGLGVLQALMARKILQKADYLSTVSGGGYIGASLTWFRKYHGGNLGRFFNSTKPFGSKDVDREDTNDFVAFLRQHGKYLAPGRGLNIISFLAVLIRSLLISVLIYFALLLVFLTIWGALGHLSFVDNNYDQIKKIVIPYILKQDSSPEIDETAIEHEKKAGPYAWEKNPFFRFSTFLALISGAAFVITGAVFTLLSILIRRLGKMLASKYVLRYYFQLIQGGCLAILILSITLATVPITHSYVERQIELVGIVGYISGIWAALVRMRKHLGAVRILKRIWAGDLLFRLGAVLFVYAALIVAFEWNAVLIDNAKITAVIFGVAVILGWFISINDSTIASLYRDRLMETFLPDEEAVNQNRWRLAKRANVALLEEMCMSEKKQIRKPYHLINTNIILSRSKIKKFKERGGDSFVLAPLHCGSTATGYVKTQDFIKDHKDDKIGLTLATAMATSGAAVNPHTGVGGVGPTRDLFVSFMMTIFNLRLGFWATNPRIGSPRTKPNYIRPGLGSLLGLFGHTEKSQYIELSDGGHFENLGIYELVRRRVDTIIVSDAGQDKDYVFGDLSNAIERVRADFGVSIRFQPEDEKFGKLLPGSHEGEGETFANKFKLAQKGYLSGTIEYPPDRGTVKSKLGKIYFIKSTLLPDLPADVYGYRARHADFPDQSTGDQFFDENQFEAYRELGYRAAKPLAERLEDKLGTAGVPKNTDWPKRVM